MGQDQLPEEARKLIKEELAKMDEKQRTIYEARTALVTFVDNLVELSKRHGGLSSQPLPKRTLPFSQKRSR